MKKIIIWFLLNAAIIFPALSQMLIQPTFVDSVEMRDGKKLAVDIYIPDTSGGVAYPVILVQTPYNRLLYRTIGLPLFGNNIASANYAMVIADWRCFYGSSAACAGNYDRAKDGYDLVEWIAARTWCDGKVGTWGPSALGRIQFMTARKRPPHLVCAVPLVAGPQYSYPEYYPGGVYRTEYVQQLDALGFGSSSTILAHQTHDYVWIYSEATNFYPDSISVPLLMIGGWYDHNINVMMDFFAGIRQSSFSNVRDKHRLLMGLGLTADMAMRVSALLSKANFHTQMLQVGATHWPWHILIIICVLSQTTGIPLLIFNISKWGIMFGKTALPGHLPV